MSGLRFCMVTTFYPPYSFGGDGIAVQRLSHALVRRGHQVTVLQDTDAHTTLNRGPEPAPEKDDRVELIRLRAGNGALSVLLTHQTGRPVLQRRALARFFDSREFDVINYHNVSLVGGAGVLSMGRGLKLYMAHEHWLVCPTHVLWRHGRELCTGRQCFRCALHHRRPPQLWRRGRFLERQLDHVDSFIAMSEFSRHKHREFGFTRKMEVVNCFLPDAESLPATADSDDTSPHDRPFYLFVGRLERIKGLDDVIPLFRGTNGADLLIAGDGEHEPTLRRLAADAPRVRFLGRVAPHLLDRYYRHTLALIVPSVCFETYGIIVIEAFRQRTPVIARRIGPLPETVERSGGGLLFDGPDELRGQMRRIESDAALRERLAGHALAGFQEHWSETAVIPQYLEVVRKTAAARGRKDLVARLDEEQA